MDKSLCCKQGGKTETKLDKTWLKETIQTFHKIFLLPDKGGLEHFCGNDFFRDVKTEKKILLLVTEPYQMENGCIMVEVITPEEAGELSRLYCTYEFTDNFLLLSKDAPSAASVFRFVESGVLSENEAWQALLT